MQLPNVPRWKIIVAILLVIAVIFISWFTISRAKSEESVDCWILCQPDSWVNARTKPNKRSEEIGRLECGDKISTDGKTKNGFLHVYVNFESIEGWVHKGYVVYDEPYKPTLTNTYITSNGRVSARKTVNGKRRCWVRNGQPIKVYMMSAEWSVTNKGFIKTEYIDIGR